MNNTSSSFLFPEQISRNATPKTPTSEMKKLGSRKAGLQGPVTPPQEVISPVGIPHIRINHVQLDERRRKRDETPEQLSFFRQTSLKKKRKLSYHRRKRLSPVGLSIEIPPPPASDDIVRVNQDNSSSPSSSSSASSASSSLTNTLTTNTITTNQQPTSPYLSPAPLSAKDVHDLQIDPFPLTNNNEGSSFSYPQNVPQTPFSGLFTPQPLQERDLFSPLPQTITFHANPGEQTRTIYQPNPQTSSLHGNTQSLHPNTPAAFASPVSFTPLYSQQQVNQQANTGAEEDDISLAPIDTNAPTTISSPYFMMSSPQFSTQHRLTVVTPQVPMSPMPCARANISSFQSTEDLSAIESDPEKLHAVAHALVQDEQYETAAEALLENIEKWHHIDSMISLGYLYEQQLINDAKRPPLHMALFYYARAVKVSNNKNTMAMHNMANVYRALNCCEAAYHWYITAVKSGDVASLTSLGCLYDAGFISEREKEFPSAKANPLEFCLKRAAFFYQAAAKHGHLDAMINLGQMYEFGRGVERNELSARHWFLQVIDHDKATQDVKSIGSDYLERVERKIYSQSSLNAF